MCRERELQFLIQFFKHRGIVHSGILYEFNEERVFADCIEQLDFADDKYAAIFGALSPEQGRILACPSQGMWQCGEQWNLFGSGACATAALRTPQRCTRKPQKGSATQ